ncbi:non-hydrolyzing UDP-N-acetylglucosamine 2-epimerase [Roseibium sp. MMSF_3412]|uniref:non-hydrolyzing UDP-N-acetylglucosamine 2-epimerase n=1 Tax=Roseibium sp. MMSF_3412 TaxID=3046712 RepID=UPI0027400C39|nr:UDP-N-acetylglucosamine 2-epimerase (non-hydrolyzing) [Roseibium sp. MMSF_3412]
MYPVVGYAICRERKHREDLLGFPRFGVSLLPSILSVVGARPQFVKAAVVSKAFASIGVDEAVVHTGQHYDDAMSGRFLSQLGMDNIAINLTVGSGNHSLQTAGIMTGLQEYLDTQASLPKAIVVYGDTNSTIAASLVAAKLGVPIMHVEAGLRSYNRAMPEEINRVMTDHVSELLFCSSETGVENLRKEGIVRNVFNVGDVMRDGFLVYRDIARDLAAQGKITRPPIDAPFCLATIHRPSNTDRPERLQTVISSLGKLEKTVIWPVHPRNRSALKNMNIPDNLNCIDPVGYLEMLLLLDACDAVLTDSGGLQKEAHWAKRPCITLRDETEWTETLEGGWNQLPNPAQDDVAALAGRSPGAPWRLLYGDGNAAMKIANTNSEHLHLNRGPAIGSKHRSVV